MPQDVNLKRRLNKRFKSLWDGTNTWRAHWALLAEQLQPRRSVALTNKKNKSRDDGSRRNSKILNSTPLQAVRTASSGMMSGITSPSRPWFRLASDDPDVNDLPAVRDWLNIVQQRMHAVFAKSNLYSALPTLYEDLIVMGTPCAIMEEDDDELLRVLTLTPGTYVLAADGNGRVATMMREYKVTAEQFKENFDEDAFSPEVKAAIAREDWDQEFTVRHAIVPADKVKSEKQRSAPKGAAINMPWQSYYWEPGQEDGKILRQGGYRRFPVLAPRWFALANEVYGRSPGMDALGDCRQLQNMEGRKARIEAILAEPPMKGPTSLATSKSSIAPASMTYVNESQNTTKYEPSYKADPIGLRELKEDISTVESRINTAFYVDLFLMLASTNRREITAREIDERHEEKLLQLGPVIERIYDEGLGPLIDFTFERMLAAGQIPDPPEVLQGSDLKVELISIMAAAQKIVVANGLERLLAFISTVGQINAEAIDKLDTDEAIELYGDLIGTPPNVLHDENEVGQIREARAQQAQQAQALAAAESAAKAAKDAGQVPVGDTNLMQTIIDRAQEQAGAF